MSSDIPLVSLRDAGVKLIDCVEVIFKRKAFLAEEINTLGAIRDALLPKLISGDIRIPDADGMFEEVGV